MAFLTAGLSKPISDEKRLDMRKNIERVGSSRNASKVACPESRILFTAWVSPRIPSVTIFGPRTATVRVGNLISAFSTRPLGGNPARVLTGTSNPATMAVTSPIPPPPLTSATWAASKALVRETPTTDATAIPDARAPDALVPKP